MQQQNAVLGPLGFRSAGTDDVDLIVKLVNSAYRGESSKLGWTTEAQFLGGQRTDADEVQDLLRQPASMILLGCQDSDVVGCVHLQKEGNAAQLGMFAIRPGLQGAGYGKQFMQHAESLVRHAWNSRAMRMAVITLREELIAFYERRGYRRTGELHPFPTSERFGLPQVPDLKFEILEKPLSSAQVDG